MINIVGNSAQILLTVGLAVFSGAFLFGAGTLTAVGWVAFLPLFIGSCVLTGVSVVEMLPDSKDGKPAAGEIDTTKTANAN